MHATDAAPPPLTPERVLSVGLGFWGAKALLTACSFGLFELLAGEGPLSRESVEQRLGLHARGGRDFLDALVSMGFLTRDASGMYANAAEAEAFLVPGKPDYVGGMLRMANDRLYPFWANLGEALRTGTLQNEAAQGGEHFFTAIYADPDRLKQFLEAMSGVSHAANRAIAARLDYNGVTTVVDVGTAQGDLIAEIAQAAPSITGIGFDLPPVGPAFEEFIASQGLAGRVQFEGGNFLSGPLPAADMLLMGHILHDWDLTTKKMLLAKAFDALSSGGQLVIYEAMIDDDRRHNTFGLLMSLNMLIESEGGFDYSAADCRSWLDEAGFTDVRSEHLLGPDSMVVARKP